VNLIPKSGVIKIYKVLKESMDQTKIHTALIKGGVQIFLPNSLSWGGGGEGHTWCWIAIEPPNRRSE
jgi:hypothetical protein